MDRRDQILCAVMMVNGASSAVLLFRQTSPQSSPWNLLPLAAGATRSKQLQRSACCIRRCCVLQISSVALLPCWSQPCAISLPIWQITARPARTSSFRVHRATSAPDQIPPASVTCTFTVILRFFLGGGGGGRGEENENRVTSRAISAPNAGEIQHFSLQIYCFPCLEFGLDPLRVQKLAYGGGVEFNDSYRQIIM